LNARTSILVAANPKYGSYNLTKSIPENIDMALAMLSRFDLLFILLDRPSVEADLKLAQHVTFVHQCLHHPKNEDQEEPIDPNLMK
jgi:DNA replication licensing factor MCM7